MARSAGSINADITVDASKAKRGVKDARKDFQSFISGLKSLAGIVGITLSVEFAVSKFKQFIGYALEISSQFEIQRAALTAIIQGQERFLDVAGRQIPVEQARTQALKKTQEIIDQINIEGMRPILRTSREFQTSVTALLPTFRQFGVELDQSVSLMKQMADTATLVSIPGDEMVNQARQILSSNISNETKLAKVVGLNNEIVNQAKVQGRLAEVLSARFGTLANQVDLIQNTLKAAQVELRNTVEIQIGEHFIEARDAVKELLLTLNEVAKSDAFANLIEGAAKFVSVLAEGAGIWAKLFELGTLDVGTANIEIAVDKSVAQFERLAKVGPQAIAKARQEAEIQAQGLALRLGDIQKQIGETIGISTDTSIEANLTRGVRQVGLSLMEAFGSEQAVDINRLQKEAEHLNARLTVINKTLERTKPLAEAVSLTGGKPLTEVQTIELKIKTEELKGNTKEVGALREELVKLQSTAVDVRTATVRAFDPTVINYQLTTLTRIDGSLQRQERTQANLRSLELQRRGLSKDVADSIGQQEAAADAMVIRQKATADAEATLVRQAENLASKNDVVVKGVLRLSDEFDAAKQTRDAETVVVDRQIDQIRQSTILTDAEKSAQIESLNTQKQQIDAKADLIGLQDRLVKGVYEQYTAAKGVAKLETEFGKLLSEQSPQALQLTTLIEDIKAREQERLAIIRAQTAELERQLQIKRIDVAEQTMQVREQFQTQRLELQQRAEEAGAPDIGFERERLHVRQEQAQLALKLTQLEEQQGLAVQRAAVAHQRVQEIQTAVNNLSVDTTEEVRQQLNLKLEEAQLEEQLAQLGVTRLENERQITGQTLQQLPVLQQQVEARKWGSAVAQDFTSSISGAIQSAIDGDFDFRKFGKDLSASLIKTAIQPFLDNIANMLSSLFTQLAVEFGQALSSAVLGIIGLLGVMALTRGEQHGAPTNAGLGKMFEERGEPLRGVIAGRQSIPVAQIHNALESALIGTNAILRQIAANTAGLRNTQSSRSQGSPDTTTAALNATATV